MRELMTLEYDLKFKNNIANIHSISIDTEYSVKDNILNGNFIILGDYKTNTISINLTDFNFNVPFTHHFNSKIKEDSVKIEIEDFVYDVKKDTLNVNIEYYLEYEEEITKYEEEITKDEEEVNKILEDDNYELIDFREDIKGTVNEKLDQLDEIATSVIERKDDIMENLIKEDTSDEYITYHVYVVDEFDTIESIVNKFNVSIDIIRDYNDFDDLKKGLKLVIPCLDD